MGEIPEKLKEEIMDENSPEALKYWLKLAARAKTLEEFERGKVVTGN